MIQIERGRVAKPKLFGSSAFKKFAKRLRQFHHAGGTRATQQVLAWREELEPFMAEALDTLRALFHKKCAYSEVELTDNDPGQLVLHRPPADAVGADGERSPEHYWWLIPAWSNWFIASGHVASVKESQFPVLGERAAAPVKGRPADGRGETALLLDPCSGEPRDDPAWHLAFYRTGWVGARDLAGSRTHPSRRLPSRSELPGVHTIRCLDLNNERLVKARQMAVKRARRGWTRILRGKGDAAELAGLLSAEAPFTAAIRQACAIDLMGTVDAVKEPSFPVTPSAAAQKRLVEALPRELAAYVLCEPTFNGAVTPLGRKLLAPLAGHLEEVFPRLGLGRRFGERLGGEKAPAAADAAGGKPVAFGVGGEAAPTPEAVERPIVGPTLHITTVTIRNFKAIRQIELSTDDLPSEKLTVELRPDYGAADQRTIRKARRWWALLGENGSGKSCFLQAVGLALTGERIEEVMKRAGIEWQSLLRRPPAGSGETVTQGRICLDFSDGATRIDLRFNRDRHWWAQDTRGGQGADRDPPRRRSGVPEIHTFVRAYGATRLLQSAADRKRDGGRKKKAAAPSGGSAAAPPDGGSAGNVRVANLFDPRAEVSDAKTWLCELAVEDFNVAAPTIAGLLQDEGLAAASSGATGKRKILSRNKRRKRVTVEGIPIELVSDGYRAVIAMACDMMRGLGEGLSTMESATGIVLIDEIGAHLHPRWRMAITGKLRRALPQVQFIVSTHEPLCLRGLQDSEVVRVDKHPQHGVLMEVVERDPSYYRVDQLLTSEFFGLDTTIEPDLERRFHHYYRLLAIPKKKRTRQQGKELQELHRYLREHGRPALGYTRRDQLLYEQIDQYLIADRRADAGATPEDYLRNRRERRRKALALVRDIWDRRSELHDIEEAG